jgi:DNA-directed RNA polymerase subunit K/omega
VVVNRPRDYNSYEFVVVSSLRAKQLLAGCTAHVDGDHTAAITAQMEVADGRIARCADDAPQSPRQCEWQL